MEHEKALTMPSPSVPQLGALRKTKTIAARTDWPPQLLPFEHYPRVDRLTQNCYYLSNGRRRVGTIMHFNKCTAQFFHAILQWSLYYFEPRAMRYDFVLSIVECSIDAFSVSELRLVLCIKWCFVVGQPLWCDLMTHLFFFYCDRYLYCRCRARTRQCALYAICNTKTHCVNKVQ